MLLALILLVACALIANVWGFFYAKRQFAVVKVSVLDLFRDLCASSDGETAPRYVQAADAFSQMLASRLANTLRAQAMAEASHTTRAANKLAEDAVTDMATSMNPMYGLALDRFPSMKKTLAKNPTALAVLGQVLQSAMGGGGKGNSSNDEVQKKIAMGGL